MNFSLSLACSCGHSARCTSSVWSESSQEYSDALAMSTLIKADLVGALAAQVFKADAAAPQVALGQAGQAVRHVHFQHIALQHGVVGIALHLDAVVGKHMAVVLDVLAQLFCSRVLQPGLELGQHLIAVQLRGRIGVAVGHRNVGRPCQPPY